MSACGGYVDLPEDCFEDELYDPVEQLCYVPLDEEESGEYYLEDRLIDAFFGVVDSFLTNLERGMEDFSEGGRRR